MANYETLKAAIAAAIKENGNKEITGTLLQQQLLAMVNSLGVGYQYIGIATPDTNPGTPDQNVFYFASTSGTYSNFGSIIVEENEIAILKGSGGNWTKEITGAAQQSVVDELKFILFGGTVTFYTGGSITPISKTLFAGQSIKSATNVVGEFRLYQTSPGNYDQYDASNVPIFLPKDYSYIQVYNAAGTGSFVVSGLAETIAARIEELQQQTGNLRNDVDALINNVVLSPIPATGSSSLLSQELVPGDIIISATGADAFGLYENQSSSPVVIYESDLPFTVDKTYKYASAYNPGNNLVLTLASRLGKMQAEIDKNADDIKELQQITVIGVPTTIFAVVGDTLQLYYEGIFDCPDINNVDVNVVCDIGAKYPRYYELTPVSSQIGNHTITFIARNKNGVIVSTKSVTLRVVSASQPATAKNILCVGSSLTEGGQWAGELKRRLTGSGGTPAGLGFNNINFVGRKELANVKVEATGGYYLGSYLTTTDIAYKFYFDAEHFAPSGIQTGAVYNAYRGGGSLLVGTFEIKEFNINDGIGYITCVASALSGTVYDSGTLIKQSGNGPDTMDYGSSGATGNPFAYDGQIDIQQYADDYCGGQIDIVCLSELFLSQLTNSGTVYPYGTNFTAFFNNLTTFRNMFKAAFPNVKFIIGTMNLPDKRGGLGTNFGAPSNMRSEYNGYKKSAIAAVLALNQYIEDNSLQNELFVMDWTAEMDNINDYTQTQKKVNPRSDVTEPFGTNGLHPGNAGYYQMADSAFRSFVANLL